MISDDAVIETCDEASKGYRGQGLVVMMQGEMISPLVACHCSNVECDIMFAVVTLTPVMSAMCSPELDTSWSYV